MKFQIKVPSADKLCSFRFLPAAFIILLFPNNSWSDSNTNDSSTLSKSQAKKILDSATKAEKYADKAARQAQSASAAATQASETLKEIRRLEDKAAKELADAKAAAAPIAAERHSGNAKRRESMSSIGKRMDLGEKYLEDYGSISISVPLLLKLGQDFSFDLKQGSSNYYNDAKTQVQGAAASFQQVVQSLSISAQGQYDPTVAAAYAAQLQNYFSSLQRYNTKQNLIDAAAQQQLQANLTAAATNTDPATRSAATAQALAAYSQQYTAPSNAPTYPTSSLVNSNLPSLSSDLPPRPGVTNVLSAQQFVPFQGLLNGLNIQPTTTDRSAILQAAGDQATESIFRYFLGNTNLNAQAAEDNVFFGFCTVSANPGWVTSKGWAAEAVMTAELKYRKASKAATEAFIAGLPLSGVQLAAAATQILGGMGYGDTAVLFKQMIVKYAPETSLPIAKSDIASWKSTNPSVSESDLQQEVQSVATQNGLTDATELEELSDYAKRLSNLQGLLSNKSEKTRNFADLARSSGIGDTNVVAFLAQHKPIPSPFTPNSTNIAPQLWLDLQGETNVSVEVTVISPLIDADVLDLSSSSRSQNEFAMSLAFALSYAGLSSQAKSFEQFVKNNQFDIRTRGQQVAVNAFSGSDGKFGFQIGPRVAALGDVGRKKSGASEKLQRQSFPALLILRMGGDLRVKLSMTKGIDGATNIQLLEPYIHFEQTRRWTPLSRSFYRDVPYFRPKDWLHPPVSEQYRLEAVAELADARNYLAEMTNLTPDVTGSIVRRIENLESQLVGSSGDVFLSTNVTVDGKPAPGVIAAITNVAPSSIIVTNTVNPLSIIFFGKGLNLVKTGTNGNPTGNEVVTLLYPAHGIITNTAVLRRMGQDLALDLTMTNVSGPLLFQFSLTNGAKSKILSWPLVVDVLQSKPPTNALSALKFTEIVSNSTGAQTTDFMVTLFTNVTEKQVDVASALIRAEMEKNKPTLDGLTNTVLKVSVSPDHDIALTNNISVTPK